MPYLLLHLVRCLAPRPGGYEHKDVCTISRCLGTYVGCIYDTSNKIPPTGYHHSRYALAITQSYDILSSIESIHSLIIPIHTVAFIHSQYVTYPSPPQHLLGFPAHHLRLRSTPHLRLVRHDIYHTFKKSEKYKRKGNKNKKKQNPVAVFRSNTSEETQTEKRTGKKKNRRGTDNIHVSFLPQTLRFHLHPHSYSTEKPPFCYATPRY